jgi:hypothetical protein
VGMRLHAEDDPSRIATVVSERSADDVPDCLRGAVVALFSEGE